MGRLSYRKALGSRNPADILTKHVASPLLDQHLVTVGAAVRVGRAGSAPTLDQVQVEAYSESAVSKVVRFNAKVTIKTIPAEGKMRPVQSSRKLRWPAETDEMKRPEYMR